MWWSLAINVLLVCICNTSGSIPDPVFAAPLYQVSVNETFLDGGIMRPAPGFLTVSCNHSNSDLMYTLMSEESIPFVIDLTTGELMVTDDLDYETTTLYNFTAICTVMGNLNITGTSTIVVSILPVNEYRPSIQPNPMVTVVVSEFTPLGLLTSTLPGNKFNVTDMDAPADTIRYTLRSPQGGAQGLYYNQTLQGIVLTQAYDRENSSNSQSCFPSQFEFRVTVCDIYPPDDHCPNIILLVLLSPANDNDPSFSQTQYSTRVNESAPANSSLLTVTCTDQDVCIGEFEGMEIVDQNSTGRFSIDQNGTIANTQLLDYEEISNHILTVRCFDSGRREAFATVEIQLLDVNDNAPRCSSSSAAGDLAVGSHELTSVLRLSCVDADSGINSQLTYTVDGDLPQVPGGRFILDQTTGELQFSGELRSNEEFEFSVDVSDFGLPPLSSKVRVGVSVTGDRMLPMLLIIVVCIVGGLLLILFLFCCCCFCLLRRSNKTKKVIFYDPNQNIAYQHAKPEGEKEVDLYIADEVSAGQQTPLSTVSVVTGEHVISTMTVVIQEKNPLGLVEAVSQQLEHHNEDNFQVPQLNQDFTAITFTQEMELQDTTQLNQDFTAITFTQEMELQDTTTQPHSASVQDTTQPQSALVQDTTQPQSALLQDTHLQDTAIDNSVEVVIDTSSL